MALLGLHVVHNYSRKVKPDETIPLCVNTVRFFKPHSGAFLYHLVFRHSLVTRQKKTEEKGIFIV